MNPDVFGCSADIPPPPDRDLQRVGGSMIQNQIGIAPSAVFDNRFLWQNGTEGRITITFDSNRGAWSWLGNSSSEGNPSMNLGWTDPPTTDFTVDGFTFSYNLYSNAHRSGCLIQNCNIGDKYSSTTGESMTCIGPSNICIDDWTPGSVVLHEFGHALGMYHEHQNYIGGNPLVFDNAGTTLFSLSQNEGICDSCTQAYCRRLCFTGDKKPNWCGNSNYCSGVSSSCNTNETLSSDCQAKIANAFEDAQTNVLKKYECTDQNCPYEGSFFDPESVMIYPIANYMLTAESPNPTKDNYSFSDTDRTWLSQMYPPENANPPTIEVLFGDGEDWQKYWVKKVITEELAPYVGINFVFNLTENPTTEGGGLGGNTLLYGALGLAALLFVLYLLFGVFDFFSPSRRR